MCVMYTVDSLTAEHCKVDSKDESRLYKNLCNFSSVTLLTIKLPCYISQIVHTV